VIEHIDVDGVRGVFAEKKTGPVTAGLTFRVGQADETLASRGITHLVEHLALHRMGLTDYHSNGATGTLLTHFYLEGSETDVVGFLGKVCAFLGELPLARLELERGILRTEESGRALPSLPGWRYGAQGYGLPSYAEWGVDRVGPEAVAEWARTWFTRENAVLWVAGPRVPSELRVDLPTGSLRPPPPPSSALDATPAWYAAGRGGVVWDAVVERSAAASAFAALLGRRLFQVLRQESGYSYSAGANYDPRDDRYATVTAYADSLPEKEDAVVGGFIDVLAATRVGAFDEADLAAVQTRVQERFAQPDADAQRAASYAGDLLLGAAVRTIEQLREAAAAVTLADVRAVAAEASGSALLKVPDGRRADWAGFAAAPTHSRDVVPGRAYPAIGEPEVALVVGAEGVSLRTPEGPVTVRFDRCAARLDRPDGSRVLIGLDGFSVSVEPTLFSLDAAGRGVIDAAVDPGRVITLPPRDPEAVPQPGPRRSAAEPRPGGPLPSRWFVGICVVITLVMGIAAIGGTIDSIKDPTAPDSSWGVTAFLWLFAVIPGWPTLCLLRQRRAKSPSGRP
jgi:hypothetical protein